MFDIYHINRNKDIDASLPANYELDEVKFINSCKTGVSLQFIYLKRRMIMTEIVADKTVEVVKNAIETADGALIFIINISIRSSPGRPLMKP